MRVPAALRPCQFILVSLLILSPGFPARVLPASAHADADRRAALADQTVPNITLKAFLTENWVDTFGWRVGETVTLTIPQAGGTTYTAQQVTTPLSFDPSIGTARFKLGPTFDLQPGQVATVSNGKIAKAMTVPDLYVDAYDPTGKTIAGHSPPNATVRLDIWMQGVGPQEVAADGNGRWEVKFAGPPASFLPSTSGTATVVDADGNSTQFQINMGSIYASVGSNAAISYYNCALGRSYTLTIDDPSNGLGKADFEKNRPCVLAGGGSYTYINFLLDGFVLDAEDQITVASGRSIRTLTIAPRGRISVDTYRDILSGANQPDTYLDFAFDNEGTQRTAQAGPDGKWSINYKEPGPNGEPARDLVPGMHVRVGEFDADGDNTGYDWLVQGPNIVANPTARWVYGLGWRLNAVVTLSIGNFSAQATTTISGWDPTVTAAYFDLTGKVDLKPGDVVTMTDGAITKKLAVTNFSITHLDGLKNELSGTGTPGRSVYAQADNSPGGDRQAMVGSDGTWVMLSDPAGFALKPGVKGFAAESNPENDQIREEWIVPGTEIEASPLPGSNPTVEVLANIAQVRGWGWTTGESVTLSIKGQEFKRTVGVNPDNDQQSFVEFDLSGILDIHPGDVVSLAGGQITKTVIVSTVTINGFDVGKDTVSGKAAPGTQVDVWVQDGTARVNRHVTANVIGDWLADFSRPGAASDENSTYDIVSGAWVNAQQVDTDGDVTMVGLCVSATLSNPFIVANPIGNNIYAYLWPLDTPLSLTISDSSGVIYRHPVTVPAGDWYWLGIDPHGTVAIFQLANGFALQPGHVIALRGGGINLTYTVTNFAVTAIDPDADTFSGIGTRGSKVTICPQNPVGFCRFTTVDATGNWTALHTDPGSFTLQSAFEGYSFETEDDRDQTLASWHLADINPIRVSSSLMKSGQSVAASLTFNNPDREVGDTLLWDWGDGTTSEDLQPALPTVTAVHQYSRPGIYELKLTIRHGSDGISEIVPGQSLIVTNTTAGIILGDGWLDSPGGASPTSPGSGDRANFLFINAFPSFLKAPAGLVMLKVGNLNFTSTTFEWLVASGGKLLLKGSGTINGKGSYAFLLNASDGQASGEADRFRIKIWNASTGQVVYDNQPGSSDFADPSTTIGGGFILIP